MTGTPPDRTPSDPFLTDPPAQPTFLLWTTTAASDSSRILEYSVASSVSGLQAREQSLGEAGIQNPRTDASEGSDNSDPHPIHPRKIGCFPR